MLKITKGLKKKKKGKKKSKDADLFTEEELEQYRKEHSAQSQAGSPKDEVCSKCFLNIIEYQIVIYK